MEKKEVLKDGTEVTIRNISMDDLGAYMEFFHSLPSSDRRYLRIDVTDKQLISDRIRQIEKGNVFRIVALKGESIIASGVLELFSDDWHENHGEIRIIVSRKFQRRNLGLIMTRELYLIAARHKVKKLIAKMMRPQGGVMKILKKMGFQEQTLIPDYVQDQNQQMQDLVIMTCDMKDFWIEFESLYRRTD